MLTGKFEYRCRRCGEIEINPCTSPDNANMLLLSLIVEAKAPLSKEFFGHIPKKFEIHNCKDNGKGLSDLIGYRVVEEY